MFSVYAPIKLRSPSSPFASLPLWMAAEGDGHGGDGNVASGHRHAACSSMSTERINCGTTMRGTQNPKASSPSLCCEIVFFGTTEAYFEHSSSCRWHGYIAFYE
ncbi:uncharacterized protein LOC143905494 [Temnothorax americanus]|uniref:uncharacterized protein LOC143905494 n=1 Tax=Temnothorax americanus TaxID=1964332 RepID=UPI0040698009